MVGTKIAIFVIIQGSKNCGASSQADVIQNYFLWNRCANKVSTKKTLLCKIFSPCRCIVSSDFDSLSPLPPIPDARMPQFLLSCPSKNIRSARTFSSNCWSVCKNATLTPVNSVTPVKFWNKVSISRTFQEQFVLVHFSNDLPSLPCRHFWLSFLLDSSAHSLGITRSILNATPLESQNLSLVRSPPPEGLEQELQGPHSVQNHFAKGGGKGWGKHSKPSLITCLFLIQITSIIYLLVWVLFCLVCYYHHHNKAIS